MDESGFAIGEKEAGRCIINAEVRQKFQAKPGRQECVCADGSVVPPLVIFRAKNLHDSGFPRASMAIGDFLAILKVGLAMFTECSGSPDVLNLRRVTKQRENIVF